MPTCKNERHSRVICYFLLPVKCVHTRVWHPGHHHQQSFEKVLEWVLLRDAGTQRRDPWVSGKKGGSLFPFADIARIMTSWKRHIRSPKLNSENTFQYKLTTSKSSEATQPIHTKSERVCVHLILGCMKPPSATWNCCDGGNHIDFYYVGGLQSCSV